MHGEALLLAGLLHVPDNDVTALDQKYRGDQDGARGQVGGSDIRDPDYLKPLTLPVSVFRARYWIRLHKSDCFLK